LGTPFEACSTSWYLDEKPIPDETTRGKSLAFPTAEIHDAHFLSSAPECKPPLTLSQDGVTTNLPAPLEFYPSLRAKTLSSSLNETGDS